MKWKVFGFAAALFFTLQCSHYDELQRNGKESETGANESHNFGADCMSCHNKKPSEAYREGGWWQIAGSVASANGSIPSTNATVELWSEPDRHGVLYYSLPVDAKGNFYTEKIVHYHGICFPAVVNNETGEYESMNQAYHDGGCNSCHGVTEELIHVD